MEGLLTDSELVCTNVRFTQDPFTAGIFVRCLFLYVTLSVMRGFSLFDSLVLLLSKQVQKVFQLHRGLPGEKLHAAPPDRAAAQAPLHPRPAQREASPHSAQRPHRPHQEEEGREGYDITAFCFFCFIDTENG